MRTRQVTNTSRRRLDQKHSQDGRKGQQVNCSSWTELDGGDHALVFARWPSVEDGDAKREDELRDRPRGQLLAEFSSEVQV